MRPSARRDGIVVRELPGETIVYDRASHQAHCLNATAASVFRLADGTRAVGEIAAGLDAGAAGARDREAAVRLALDELRGAGLLEGEAPAWPSRREALRRVGAGAALLLPAVVSILAPTPAEAVTTCVTDCAGKPPGTQCATIGDCSVSVHVCDPCERCTDQGISCP